VRSVERIFGYYERHVLVSACERRHPLLPDVRTFHEHGYSDLAISDWLGVVTTPQTPRNVIARLASDIRSAVAVPAVQNALRSEGFDPVSNSSPGHFKNVINSDVARYSTFIAKNNIQLSN